MVLLEVDSVFMEWKGGKMSWLILRGMGTLETLMTTVYEADHMMVLLEADDVFVEGVKKAGKLVAFFPVG